MHRVPLIIVVLVCQIFSYLHTKPNALSILFPKLGDNVWEYQNSADKIYLKGFFEAEIPTTLEWAKKKLFTNDELWGIFDKLLPGADILAVESVQTLPELLNNYVSAHSLKQWVIRTHNGIVAFINLSNLDDAYYLTVQKIPAYQSIYYDLQLTYNNGLNQFQGYTNTGSDNCILNTTSPCSLVHSENNNLNVSIYGSGEIVFSMSEPSTKPLHAPSLYATLSHDEQLEFQKFVLDYLEHEYAIMVKSFIGTSSSLFNWHIWEWLDLKTRGFVTLPELERSLNSLHKNPEIKVYSYKKNGLSVDMFCTLDGQRRMNIKGE